MGPTPPPNPWKVVPTVASPETETREAVESAKTLHAGPERPPEQRELLEKLLNQVNKVQAAHLKRTNLLPGSAEELRMEIASLVSMAEGSRSLLGPREHQLKMDATSFGLAKTGTQRYAVRKFDRDFRVGDVLVLAEFDRTLRVYSGTRMRARVTCITYPGTGDLPGDLGVLGFEVE